MDTHWIVPIVRIVLAMCKKETINIKKKTSSERVPKVIQAYVMLIGTESCHNMATTNMYDVTYRYSQAKSPNVAKRLG